MAGPIRRFFSREDGMSKLFKTLLLLVVLVAVAAGLYALARGGKGSDNEQKQGRTVEKGSIIEKAVAVGQIQPRQKFRSSRRSPGSSASALVKVGDTVKAGDPLFEIAPDPTPLEVTEVDRQRGVDRAPRSERAEGDYERSQRALQERRAAEVGRRRRSSEAFELAKVAADQGRAGSRPDPQRPPHRRAVGTESIIRAPAAGTILTRAVNPGDPDRPADLVPARAPRWPPSPT